MLPQIELDIKTKILGLTPDFIHHPPESKQSQTAPLFFGETKSCDFWTAVILNYNIFEIEDVSPGNGTLALACLKTGIRYTGYVSHDLHRDWLQNSLNLEAAKQAATTGAKLHDVSLADALNSSFAELLSDVQKPQPKA